MEDPEPEGSDWPAHKAFGLQLSISRGQQFGCDFFCGSPILTHTHLRHRDPIDTDLDGDRNELMLKAALILVCTAQQVVGPTPELCLMSFLARNS